jgi:hypothetical protein
MGMVRLIILNSAKDALYLQAEFSDKVTWVQEV